MANGSAGIVRKDVESMRRVRLWLGTQAGNALECDVLDEVIERVEKHTKTAALVRIRIKNAGTPPGERARLARQENIRKARATAMRNRTDLWQEAELDQLRALVRDDLSDAAIGERLGRTESAVETKRLGLGLRRGNGVYRFTERDKAMATHVGAQWRAQRGGQIRNETPYQRAKRVLRERGARG